MSGPRGDKYDGPSSQNLPQAWMTGTGPTVYCRHCKTQARAFTTAGEPWQEPNHVVHGIMSLLTLGLWLPIWLIICLLPPRCGNCGRVA